MFYERKENQAKVLAAEKYWLKCHGIKPKLANGCYFEDGIDRYELNPNDFCGLQLRKVGSHDWRLEVFAMIPGPILVTHETPEHFSQYDCADKATINALFVIGREMVDSLNALNCD